MAGPATGAQARPATGSHQRQQPLGEACPLCGAPLAAEQEWCLRCGAAARTRLAATPNWKTPVATLGVIAALALGVLAAALVKLAGDSGPPPAPTTTTVTAAAAPTTAPVPATVPTTVPATPLTPTSTTTSTAPGAPGAAGTTPTTITPGSAGGGANAGGTPAP